MSSPSPYSRSSTWNTLLQPFYIISTVVGVLIGTGITALAIRGCAQRGAARRRFVRAVDAGWAIPVFNVSDDVDEAKSATGPRPVMRESVLDLNGGVHVEGWMWEQALPLSMILLPKPTSRPRDLLLYLLRSPSFFTPNLFSRLKAIQSVRSTQSHYHHRFLAPPTIQQDAPQQSVRHKPSIVSISSRSKSKGTPPEAIVTEPVQVMFVIAMPNAPLHPRISPATSHEPTIAIASQELCVGVLSASLQVPVRYLKGRQDDQAMGIHHGNMQVVEEEGEGNYASTIHSRRPRSEDPGHEYTRSLVSSRRMDVGDYRDERSSYMPHRTASASPSFWEDHVGATGGGGGSTHDTHNSYLVPPSFRYRSNVPNQGPEDIPSIENQHQQIQNHRPRSGESSSYTPSRVYTPSIVSANALPPKSSTITATPASPPSPRVLISDLGGSSEPPGDIVGQQSNRAGVENTGLAEHRASQFTDTTDTTASATDVEGGYDADADAGRRLSIRPKGAARRRAGS